MMLRRRSHPKLLLLESIRPRKEATGLKTAVYVVFLLNIPIVSDFIAILGCRATFVGRPEDQTVEPVPSFPRTEVASVGPVLTRNSRSRPDAGPSMRPEDSVGLARSPTEPARANPVRW
jgi:hypothetical protein